MEMASAFSTYRVSRDVPFKWKNILNFNYVDEIQVCNSISKNCFHLLLDFVTVLHTRSTTTTTTRYGQFVK